MHRMKFVEKWSTVELVLNFVKNICCSLHKKYYKMAYNKESEIIL